MDPAHHMEEVLLDRYVVRFIDELTDEIEETGAPPLSDTLDRVLGSIPASLSRDEWEDAGQEAIEEAILRYRVEVEEPAAAILRKRKASRPSAVNKVEVGLTGVNEDAAFYREILDGIEPELEIAEPPKVTSLNLRVSWPPDFCFRNWPFSGFVSSVNHNIAVLYVGPGRPCHSLPWFYLLYDSWANSISVIPQLPSWAANSFSHGGLGTGVAVLRHSPPSGYVLAELLLCREQGFTSNKAEMFLWWSSGNCAGRWIQKKVKLPLPSESNEHSSKPNYRFHADEVLAIGSRGLCWVDLLQGVLICDDVLVDCPQFCFIPLPAECVIDSGHQSRGVPKEYRSVATSYKLLESNVLIKFVTMNSDKEESAINVTLTVWTIQRSKTNGWLSEWVKGPFMCLGHPLQGNPFMGIRLQQLKPIMPIISGVKDNVVYLSFLEPKQPELVSMGGDHFLFVDDFLLDNTTATARHCSLRAEFNLESKAMLSALKSSPSNMDVSHPYVFASDFSKVRGDWIAAFVKGVEEDEELR